MQTETEPRSSLDSPTKLDRAVVPNEVESRWLLNLYPDAGEAGGCFQRPPRPWDGRERYESHLVLVRPDQYVVWAADAVPDDPSALFARVTGQAH